MYKYLAVVAIASVTFTSCKRDGVQKTETGLQYRFITETKGKKPAKGDVLSMHMIYKTETDSVLFDSKKMAGDKFKVALKEPAYKGSIEEGFGMLAVGDSAEFKVVADSVFEKIFRAQLPAFIKKGSMLTFNIKMENIQTEADYKKEMEEKSKAALMDEANTTQKYITDNNITAQPNPSGLYYVEKVKGTGAKAEKGKKVSVIYKGMLLNGTVFDQSKDNAGYEFTLGVGEVIPGWDEGIAMMNEGGKALLVIPSTLGYGPRGNGPIPPNSPLVFEVELSKVAK